MALNMIHLTFVQDSKDQVTYTSLWDTNAKNEKGRETNEESSKLQNLRTIHQVLYNAAFIVFM